MGVGGFDVVVGLCIFRLDSFALSFHRQGHVWVR